MNAAHIKLHQTLHAKHGFCHVMPVPDGYLYQINHKRLPYSIVVPYEFSEHGIKEQDARLDKLLPKEAVKDKGGVNEKTSNDKPRRKAKQGEKPA